MSNMALMAKAWNPAPPEAFAQNVDYTTEIPPIAGTYSEDEYLDELDQEVGCECERDWKCGVCRENGYRHSIIDGPAFYSAASDYDEMGF